MTTLKKHCFVIGSIVAFALMGALAYPQGGREGQTAGTTATLTGAAPGAALMRGWLAEKKVEADLNNKASDPADADWRRYVEILKIEDLRLREKSLRKLYGKTKSPLLRGVILRAIAEDPDFISRQAMFIRRYGFYANWFNRFTYSTVQVLQGNLQASLQLVVDGFNDLFRPGEADPLERRALAMARRAEALRAQGRGRTSARKIAKLERAVARALADADMDRAAWAMNVGDPEAAAFYARQAAVERPGWGHAEKFALKADAEAARQRRQALASSQVGYPDRQPPFDPAPEALLRAILGGDELKKIKAQAHDALIAGILADLPAPGAGRSTMMRPWEQRLAHSAHAPEPQRRWLSAMIYDPDQNPDERLSEARSRQRGRTWHFIFLGPEHPRERVYKTASWTAATWNALQNVGIFYVFEVMARSVQAVFAPPVPAEELLDAQAGWLRLAPDPHAKEARKIGRELAKTYLRQKRYDNSRQTLERIGELDAGARTKIDRAEARWLLTQAEAMPQDETRQKTLTRAAALAHGGRLARRADKLMHPKKRKEAPQELALAWSTLRDWTHQPPPCGLPGDPAWFDGRRENGERDDHAVVLTRKEEAAPIEVNYFVREPHRTRVYQAELPPKGAAAEAARRWFDLAARQRSEADQAIRRLGRLPVPFSVEGGAGPSGVDLAPKLLPMQTKPGEIELYK